MACAGCGFLCAPDFAFCPRCGTATADAPKIAERLLEQPAQQAPSREAGALGAIRSIAPTEDADRRTITVLFADLSGFTLLSEQLDPEVVRSLQNDLFEELTAAVEAVGGFVDKFIGDALLALFGAPLAHEDDPERALRAALDMIRRTTGLGERSAPMAGMPLTLHIGVNTGPVVTGKLGAGSTKSYSVTGDTVNTAQRLQSLASPGEILVGGLTHRLTRHSFSFETLGQVPLRGRVGSVLVHRLVGPLEAPRPARGLEALGLAAPLVGRDGELARLMDSLAAACAGTALLVRLVGVAGIGKSRLVDEFIARARDDGRFAGLAVRRAGCSPLGEQPYGALGAIVRSAYGLDQKASPAETREKLAEAFEELGLTGEEIGRLMPLYLYVLGLDDPEGGLPLVEPEQLRRQIFFAVRTLFERRLALSPLLVIVEDLHWADTVSLEALRQFADRLDGTRLMLLTTQRPQAALDPLDSSRVSQIALRLTPLRTEDGTKLLQAVFEEDWADLSGALCRRILDRADGNPLFIEEIIRGLVEGGILRKDGQHWHMTVEDVAPEIPANIQAMLLSRVDRLPAEVRRLAQDAAVIGPQFSVALLGATAADPAGVEPGLDLLCDAEIIEEASGSSLAASRSYRFTQSLLQDVIYQNLLVQRRVEMHGRVALALEHLCADGAETLHDLVMLGHHFSLGTDKPKGARYLMAAGDRARSSYANDDAVGWYRQALSSLSGIEAPERIALCERIADLSGQAGKRDLAHENYRAALQALAADGDRQGQARILRKVGRLLWEAGRRGEAEARYEEAGALLDPAEASVERALLLQERGRLACRSGDHASAVRWADHALAHAAAIPPDADAETTVEAARAIAEALNTKGVALARLGRNDDAIGEVERSIGFAEKNGLPTAACRGYTNLSVLYSVSDPGRALDACRRGLEAARRIGDLGFQARLLASLAVAACTFTDRCGDEGIPAAEEAIALDRALDQREHLAVPLTVLGQIHQCHGRPDLAAQCYHEALDVALEFGEPQLLFPCYDGLATLSLDLDQLPEAERYFALAQDVCARHGLDPESLVVLPFLD